MQFVIWRLNPIQTAEETGQYYDTKPKSMLEGSGRISYYASVFIRCLLIKSGLLIVFFFVIFLLGLSRHSIVLIERKKKYIMAAPIGTSLKTPRTEQKKLLAAEARSERLKLTSSDRHLLKAFLGYTATVATPSTKTKTRPVCVRLRQTKSFPRRTDRTRKTTRSYAVWYPTMHSYVNPFALYTRRSFFKGPVRTRKEPKRFGSIFHDQSPSRSGQSLVHLRVGHQTKRTDSHLDLRQRE